MLATNTKVSSSVTWKSSRCLVVKNIRIWSPDSIIKQKKITFINDQNKEFEENYDFIEKLIKDDRLRFITSDEEKAKMYLISC